MRKTGNYKQLGELEYFIPSFLPPGDPPLEINAEIISLYGEASFALGQLDEMSERLPNPNRFIKAYVIKEALISSSIEGIYTTLAEAFTYSAEDSTTQNKNTKLVLNYTKALNTALELITKEKLPLVLRVLLKAHEALMQGNEGSGADPGNFRKQSVKVGNLVPPPATEIANLMANLEKFINEPSLSDIPSLIKAGLAHVQFETIHPFLDGNGRIGRLLIVLMFINDGLLKLPILYPSYYFKKYHSEYYKKLDRVRTHGDFEGWIIYYLKAIREAAKDAYRRAKAIEKLEADLKLLVQTDSSFSKIRETAILALDFLFNRPITDVSNMSKSLDKAYNTTKNILEEFLEHKLVSKNIVNQRNKIYIFKPYLKLLEEEYDTEN